MQKNFETEFKKAFTLSEVLVALCLVGVLGAVLIPVIISSKPEASKVMLKKEYGILEKAISKMINDDSIYPADQTTTLGAKTVSRGFNYTTDPTGRVSAGTNKFCYYLAQTLNTLGPANCSGGPSNNGVGWGAGHFITTDGADWNIYIKDSDANPNNQFPVSATDSVAFTTIIYIDVNGLNNNPNCTADPLHIYQPACPSVTDCSSSPDRFTFGVRYDGKIDIGGYYYSGTKIMDPCAISILSAPLNASK